jgi:hypothetical protein
LVIALVGGVLALVFSGGGVSKEEFIEQADDICRSVGERTSALTAPTDLESTGEFFAAVIPLLEEETSGIKALEAPDEDRETLDAWLDTQERLAVTFQEAADAANADDQEGFDAAFTEANAIQAESSRLAAEYEFNVCGISTPS